VNVTVRASPLREAGAAGAIMLYCDLSASKVCQTISWPLDSQKALLSLFPLPLLQIGELFRLPVRITAQFRGDLRAGVWRSQAYCSC
jgi:hypothetical protein